MAWGALSWAFAATAVLALPPALLSASTPAAPRPPAAAIDESLLERPADALRAALEARDAGHPERAAAALARIAQQHPIVADHAERLRVRVWLEAGEPLRALQVASHAAERFQDSPLRSDFERAIGDAQQALGDEPAARRAWERARDTARSRDDRVALGLAVAESFERSGQPAAAAEIYRSLWREHPTAAGAPAVARQLERLEEALGSALRTPRDWLARADALYRHGYSERALASYERALEGELPAQDRRHAEERSAHCLFRLRRYDESAAAFAALGSDADARFWHARSVARAGDVPRAVDLFKALGKTGRDWTPQRARLLAGILLDDDGHTARARALFEKIARGAWSPELRASALWRLGWADYRDGRPGPAREKLLRMAELEAHPIDRLRPRYWAARAAARAGLPESETELAAIARDYPLSYYGWRAAERAPDGAVQRTDGERLPDGPASLAPREIERARILIEAGLTEAGEAELDRLRSQARGLSDRLALARLYTELDRFDRAQSLVVTAYAEPLARGPEPGREELWWHSWPQAWSEVVEASLPPGDRVDPALVYAIMREESGYRPEIVSPAGARGLLQIMPETGEALARRLALAGFSAEDLFRPRVNIRLGSFYLDALAQRFPERPAAAIGSYNAGPETIARWIEESPALDDDEWVEAIPYAQTRAYVKRVLRSLHAYRELY